MTRRKDGRWQEVLLFDGRKKYFYGKTKAEVLRKINAFRDAETKSHTFCEVAEAWQEEHWEKIVPSTARGYTASLRRAIDVFADRQITDIKPQQINSFLLSLAAKGYGKKVVVTQKNVLNLIFEFAIRQGHTETNPCTSIHVPGGLAQKRRELPTEEELKIVKNSEWLYPFFLLCTGCRRGEALAVRYEDIDRENGVIHINKAIGYAGNRPYIKRPKTEAGCRDVVLLDTLAQRIPYGKGLLFPGFDGKLISNNQITRLWKMWQQENQTTLTQHQLRHGYATILYEAGLPPKDAQYLMGHSNISVTQDIYTHISNSRKREISALLNAYVLGEKNVMEVSDSREDQ